MKEQPKLSIVKPPRPALSWNSDTKPSEHVAELQERLQRAIKEEPHK